MLDRYNVWVADTGNREDDGLGARLARAVAGPPGWMANAPVTRALLWVNVILYVVELFLAKKAGAVAETPDRVMLLMGANYSPATLAEHRYETLLTSCFLHFSILHVTFNMYALRQIGPPIERSIGSARMAPMVLVSGIGGSAVSTAIGLFLGDERLGAGASGAICGVIGAALVLGLRADGRKSPLAWAMGRWLLMLLALQFIAQLAHLPTMFDNAAHFGGAAVGALFAATWRRGPPHGVVVRRTIMGASAATVALAFAIVAMHDARDPYARMRAGNRYEVARALLEVGTCDEAARAVEATRRLLPHAPEVLSLEQELAARCGGAQLP
jgi:rhomboid protease GluP